jgi:rRNA maturation endonuclease Nob1
MKPQKVKNEVETVYRCENCYEEFDEKADAAQCGKDD